MTFADMMLLSLTPVTFPCWNKNVENWEIRVFCIKTDAEWSRTYSPTYGA
jgi:hypothetical protein